MNFILIYILFEAFSFVYSAFVNRMIDKQRALPLPEEVNDVYDAERYATFLSYKSDIRKHNNKFSIINTCILFGLIFLGTYKWIDFISGNNEYLVALYSSLIPLILTLPLSYYKQYIFTFKISEKYKMNKKTRKEFNKDFFLNAIPSEIISIFALFLLIAIVHTISNSNLYPISLPKAFVIAFVVMIVIVIAMLVITLISLVIFRKTYTFTEMEDNELKHKIYDLLKGVKKKIYHIYVYDESKKSISKNAFVLHLLFYREISIADNFLNENDEDELLAVLAHEVGHLKHKKTFLEYMSYVDIALLFCLLVYCIYNPTLLEQFVSWINSSFDIQTTNYVLVIMAIETFFSPLSFLISLFTNYISRGNEYEADQNAVKEGYGEALIKTFKTLSNDELVDVHPCKWVEITEYNHPGMTNRIRAIRKSL